jgi:hypothetical protein
VFDFDDTLTDDSTTRLLEIHGIDIFGETDKRSWWPMDGIRHSRT